MQSMHAALPLAALYLPAAQAEHVAPSGPVKPGLQMQLLSDEDPGRDCEFTGQGKHVLIALAPTDVE